MFYVFEVAIVVPLFSFFSSKFFFICTIPRFAHSLFNVGLLLSSLGSSEGAPPPLQSCFWLFYTDIESSRVEQQQQLVAMLAQGPSCSWARSLGVGRAYRAGRAAFREPMVYRELF